MTVWTKEQLQALQYDIPAPLLISAAAGSGKTTVLIERIYRRVMEGKIEPENILVMTFTDKAALQMRQKIEKKITDEMMQTDDPEKLAKLRDLKRRFPLAKISTIHSFCLNLIRDYAAFLTDEENNLLLNPGFTPLSNEHVKIYLDQAIDDVLNYIYEQKANLENSPEAQNTVVPSSLPRRNDDISLFSLIDEKITVSNWISDFYNMAFIMTESLTDDQLRIKIASSWKQLRSIAYFDRVIQKAVLNYQKKSQDFSQSKAFQEYMSSLEKLIKPALSAISKCEKTDFVKRVLSGKQKSIETKYLPEKLLTEKSVLQEIQTIFEKDIPEKEKWNLIHEQSQRLEGLISLNAPKSNAKNPEIKQEFISLYEPNVFPVMALLNPNFVPTGTTVKRNFLENVNPVFSLSTEQIETDMQSMIGTISRFYEVILLVEKRMQQIKFQYNCVDFNDFEHFALQLLDQETIANAVKSQYQEIYLDEYQDTNPIQETIVQRIQCPRLFMVGDLKQSIYRFRHANPGLFRQKLKQFTLFDEIMQEQATNSEKLAQQDGYVILLNKNFRSAETILKGINEVFSWFMQEEIAEITYDETQRLIPGNNDLKESEIKKRPILIEHLVYQKEDIETVKSIFPALSDIDVSTGTKGAFILEALQAVRLIKEEVAKGRRYKDFAILGRTNPICDIYAEVLRAFQIPASVEKTKEFLDSTELRFLIRLFELLDNQRQDIPLGAVLRSPIFGLSISEDELLLCKLLIPERVFYHEIVESLAQMSEEKLIDKAKEIVGEIVTKEDLLALQGKLKKFLFLLAEIRKKARWFSLGELLDYIFSIADYQGYLASLPFAEQRLEDIEKFKQWANQFTRENGGGLHQFVLFIKQMIEKKIVVENFAVPPSESNSVSIMTIHASKGLEVPYVFIAGANYKNDGSKGDPIITFNPDDGIAAYIADANKQIIFNNPEMLWYQQQLKNKEWAEEYRLLYVAMTRAKETLCILSNRPEKKENVQFQTLHAALSESLTLNAFQKISTFFEIIVAYLATKNQQMLQLYTEEHPSSEGNKINFENYQATIWPTKRVFDSLQRVISQEQAEAELKGAETPTIAFSGSAQQEKIDRIKHLITDFSEQDRLSQIPAKLTVSELKRMQEHSEEDEEAKLYPQGMADMSFNIRRKLQQREIEQSEKLKFSGAEFGTLIHSIMNFLNLPVFYQEKEEKWHEIYHEQIEQMIAKQKMTEKIRPQAEYAYPFVEHFLQSDIAKRLAKAEMEQAPIYREIPFTLAVPAIGIDQDSLNMKDEKTLVQGIIDLWFMDHGKAVLLDYKSDYIPGDETQVQKVLEERYKVQLDYYAMAIEKIIGLEYPVQERYIWLLREGKAYQI